MSSILHAQGHPSVPFLLVHMHMIQEACLTSDACMEPLVAEQVSGVSSETGVSAPVS